MGTTTDNDWTTAFEATPAGTDQGNVLDDRIKELKANIRQRLSRGGHVFTDDPDTDIGHGLSSNRAIDGRHTVNAEAGQENDSPHIWKSDAVTKLVQYTDTLVTVHEDLTLVAGKDLTVGNDLTVTNDATVTNDLTVTNDATVSGNLILTATGEIQGQPDIIGASGANLMTTKGGVSDRDCELVVDATASFSVSTPTTIVTGSNITLSDNASTSAKRVILINFSCVAYTDGGITDAENFDVRIKRNDNGAGFVETYEPITAMNLTDRSSQNGDTPISFTLLDVISRAGTPTVAYEIEMEWTTGGSTVTVNQSHLSYVELFTANIAESSFFTWV